MTDDDRNFTRRVMLCAEDMETFMPELMLRYSPVAVMTALAEHVGNGLQVLMQRGDCTAEEAHAVLNHAQTAAALKEHLANQPNAFETS